MTRILAISGSIRTASFNTQALRSLPALAPEGMAIEVFKGVEELPHFSQDLEEDPPQSVLRMREAISEADGLVISTPEYNRSMPGVLKNALDWASRPYGKGVLTGKPAVVLSASPSNTGGLAAQLQLRSLLNVVNVYLVGGPMVAIPEVHNRLTVQGDVDVALSDETTRGMLTHQLLGLQYAVADGAAAKLTASAEALAESLRG